MALQAPRLHTSLTDLPDRVTADQVVSLREQFMAVRVLDVRTTSEYASQHIGGAYNLPLDQLRMQLDRLAAGVRLPVLVVCRSGPRSERAAAMLRRVGLTDVHVVEGGMRAWMESGYPVEGCGSAMDHSRQARLVIGAITLLGAVLAMLVHPMWALLAAGMAIGLLLAGATSICFMEQIMAEMPFNRAKPVDIAETAEAMATGQPAPDLCGV